jgi:hypothetical protein
MRLRLERFGKPSVALARCQDSAMGPAPKQSGYEPLFRSASEVLTDIVGCSVKIARQGCIVIGSAPSNLEIHTINP